MAEISLWVSGQPGHKRPIDLLNYAIGCMLSLGSEVIPWKHTLAVASLRVSKSLRYLLPDGSNRLDFDVYTADVDVLVEFLSEPSRSVQVLVDVLVSLWIGSNRSFRVILSPDDTEELVTSLMNRFVFSADEMEPALSSQGVCEHLVLLCSVLSALERFREQAEREYPHAAILTRWDATCEDISSGILLRTAQYIPVDSEPSLTSTKDHYRQYGPHSHLLLS